MKAREKDKKKFGEKKRAEEYGGVAEERGSEGLVLGHRGWQNPRALESFANSREQLLSPLSLSFLLSFLLPSFLFPTDRVHYSRE